MILVAALSMADARLYEAADALGASQARVFFTVTLPGAKYGLMSAAFVVFTLVITDFGIAKVIGGRFNVLATDIYKQVIGQQNFAMGAVVGFVLLIPAVVAFVADRITQRRQVALISARAVPLQPKPAPRRDWLLFAFCFVVGGLIVGILAMAAWASLVTRWPYNLTLTLKNYAFGDFDTNGWAAYWNSLQLSIWTAAIGTFVVFFGAWLLEKTRGFAWGARYRAVHGDAADGGAGPRHRPCLHLLLQREVESVRLHLRDDDHPRRKLGHALLHREPPDRRHRAQAARQRIRGGVVVAQGVALAHDVARDGAGVPAAHPRHQHLPLRQRDDDGVGGDLPLLDQHQARVGHDHQHG
jgi:ABC-type spermidine/putrescine transport system permease subunit I